MRAEAVEACSSGPSTAQSSLAVEAMNLLRRARRFTQARLRTLDRRIGRAPNSGLRSRRREHVPRDDGEMDTDVLQLHAGARLVIDITQVIVEFCRDRGDGMCHVFVPHATAGVTLIETGSGF
jgi:hypothetical protein